MAQVMPMATASATPHSNSRCCVMPAPNRRTVPSISVGSLRDAGLKISMYSPCSSRARPMDSTNEPVMSRWKRLKPNSYSSLPRPSTTASAATQASPKASASGEPCATSQGRVTAMTSAASEKNSPCAKFTMRMTPKISVRPSENSTYTAPICKALTSNCT
jgi:hypothetical protein